MPPIFKNSLKNKTFLAILLVIIPVLIILFSTGSLIAATKHANVLVISSYHAGFGGTDPMVEGIKTAFSKQDMDIDCFFEYLDSKRFSLNVLFPLMENFYQTKFEHSTFDVIIVADNNALNFIRKLRDSLFPNIPVVFCGINNYRDSMIENMPLVTGVVEDISIQETISLALDLHPGTTHLGVISDSTTTGIANLEKFRTIIPILPPNLNVIDLGNLTAEGLKLKLEALPERTVLLQLSFYMDAEGKRFTQKQQMDFILKQCDNPIYSAWDFFIAHGVIGGIVTYFPLQGETAGNMAIELIKGKPIDQIPIVERSPNVPLFDYKALFQHRISLSELPAESVILNQPQTFYYNNKPLVWSIFVCVIVQSLIIGALIAAIHRRKTAEKLLIESEFKYRTLIETASDAIYMVSDKGRIIDANQTACSMLGRKKKEIIGLNIGDIDPGQPAEIFLQLWKDIPFNEPQIFETAHKRKNGSLIPVEVSCQKFKIGNNIFYYGIVRDITDRKQAQESLKESRQILLMVLDGIEATIYVSDMDTYEVLYMNDYMKKTYGEDLTGKTCWKVFRNESSPCSFCTNDTLIDNDGQPTSGIKWDDQNPVTGRYYVNHDRAIKWIDGRVVRLQIATDITEFKQLEERLLQAQKLESIGTLAGGIAHDFNNILFPIIGLSELLLEDLPAQRLEHENVQEILKAGQRGAALVQQILAFSRQNEHKLIPVKIDGLVKSIFT